MANEFSDRIYPILAGQRLAGRRIGVVGLGGLPGGTLNDIESALEPTGANLVAVGVVREPPDTESLAGALADTRFADLAKNPDTLQALGTGVGRQLVVGGNLLERSGSRLFSRLSGRFGNLDGVVVARDQPENMNNRDREATGRLETGLLDGIDGTGVEAVGVEPTDADPSSISFFADHGLSTVDDIDLVPGKVAMVFALLGAEGNFGVKGSADRLLPDLLTPAPVIPAEPAPGSRSPSVGSGRPAGR